MKLTATGYRTKDTDTITPLTQSMDFEIAQANFSVLGTTNFNKAIFPDGLINMETYNQVTWGNESVPKSGTSLSTVARNFATWAGITREKFLTWPVTYGKQNGEYYVYGKFDNGYTIVLSFVRGKYGTSSGDDKTMGFHIYFSDSDNVVIKGDGSISKANPSTKNGTVLLWNAWLVWSDAGELTEPHKAYCAINNGYPVILTEGTTNYANTSVPNSAFIIDTYTGGTPSPEPTPGGLTSDNMPIFIFPTDKNDPEFVAGAVGTNLISAYSMSLDNLKAFANILWGKGWVADLKNFFSNPLDSIIRLIKIPITPATDGLSWIYLGDFKMDTPGKYRHVQQQWISVDLGKIEIARYFNSFLDFAPYTSISLFLPFLGFKDIEVNEVMGQVIRIVYQVDVLSGDFLAIVAGEYNGGVNEVPLYQFEGNCAVEVPLGNSSLNIAAAISSGLSAITVAGGLAGAVGAGLGVGSIGANLASEVPKVGRMVPGVISATEHKVSRSGGLNGNMGYTANMYPYAVITRNVPDKPDNFQTLIGQPSNQAVTISSLSGYAEIEAIHVDQISATQDELQQIERLLLGGVIL